MSSAFITSAPSIQKLWLGVTFNCWSPTSITQCSCTTAVLTRVGLIATKDDVLSSQTFKSSSNSIFFASFVVPLKRDMLESPSTEVLSLKYTPSSNSSLPDVLIAV